MPPRRALRFTVEALFLALLAAALIFADVEPAVIVGVMAVGWFVVALFEWAATRERPHYGRGLPPRYYVPQVALPPPRPLEQLPTAYTNGDSDDDTPTWIASPALREEVLGAWPAVETPEPRLEDTVVGELPAYPLEAEPPAETSLDLDGEDAGYGWAQRLPEPAQPAAGGAGAELAGAYAAEELLADEEGDSVDDEADSFEEVPRPLDGAPFAASAFAVDAARHQLDPFPETAARRRRMRRKAGDEAAFVEVPAGPPLSRVLPGQSRREA